MLAGRCACGLAGLPTACPACGGSAGAAPDKPCPICLAAGVFRFDLSCWNYSRLHFVGGRPTAETPMADRTVMWARGYGLDTLAWSAGSGFDEWWAAHGRSWRRSSARVWPVQQPLPQAIQTPQSPLTWPALNTRSSNVCTTRGAVHRQP